MADASKSERDEDVVAYTGFAGVRNDVASERFSAVDLEVADNIDLDNTGKISRRLGRVKRNATATHSLWSDGGVLGLCVQGTQLKKLGLDYALTTVKSGLTAGLRVSYTKINDAVYFANGAQNGVLEGSVSRSWGLPVPGTPPVATGVGNMPAGTYQYVVVYARIDGQESGAGLGARVTLAANSRLTFTFAAVPDSTITERHVYITTPNGDTLYHALTVPAATLSAAYAGDTSEFSYSLKTQFLQAPPVGHLTAYYNGRAYVAVDDAIFVSEPFAYELFDLRNYFSLNGRVTLMAPMEDKENLDSSGLNSGLFLGTNRNCGILVGTAPENFRYVPKLEYGAIEGALDYVDGTVFGDGSSGARMLPMFLSSAGVCIGLPGLEIRNLTTPRFSFAAAGLGAAIYDPTPNRFIAVSNF